MKKFVLAAFCTVSLVSYVLADDFVAVITKVEGNKITYFKTKAPDPAAAGKKGGKKGGGGGKAVKDGEAITGTASASIKVAAGKKNADTGKMEAGDAIEGGLTNDMFKTIDPDVGVTVTLTIEEKGADKDKITQILKGGKGGGKKKGGN